jgi:hypothetical protein
LGLSSFGVDVLPEGRQVSWRYQIIRREFGEEFTFGVHEVYVRESDGAIQGYTDEPERLIADTERGLVKIVDNVKADICEFPLLIEGEFECVGFDEGDDGES